MKSIWKFVKDQTGKDKMDMEGMDLTKAFQEYIEKIAVYLEKPIIKSNIKISIQEEEAKTEIPDIGRNFGTIYKNGKEDTWTDCLTIPDLTTRILRALNNKKVEEVRIRPVSIDETNDLKAFKEIIKRARSPEQITAMRKLFEEVS